MKVTLEHLTKRFPNRNKKIHEDVIAVNDFSFEIPDGKLVGLLGPSGCGKSTALNLICGLEKPTEGKIFFDTEDVTDLPPEKRGVGMVFQNYALYPHMTVMQNIIFPLQNFKGKDRMTREQMEERAREVAKLVQIEGLMERRPSEMSGGQQQRVAIARALVKLPRILLLDEPLSNLDARLRLSTREEIRRIQTETGITTIFVTHDQEEAMSISDLIIVMKDGVIQQIGKPQDVYENPVNLFVAKFLGTPPINVFHGRVEDGALFLGENRICEIKVSVDKNTEDASSEAGTTADSSLKPVPSSGPVTVGIRPEGFLPDPEGALCCKLQRVEVMGRDISVVSAHEALDGAVIRSIISSEMKVDPEAEEVRFRIRPAKLYLFDENGGERLNSDCLVF